MYINLVRYDWRRRPEFRCLPGIRKPARGSKVACVHERVAQERVEVSLGTGAQVDSAGFAGLGDRTRSGAGAGAGDDRNRHSKRVECAGSRCRPGAVLYYPACGAARSSLGSLRDWSHLALNGSPWKTARMPSYPLPTPKRAPPGRAQNAHPSSPALLQRPTAPDSVLHDLVPALFTCHPPRNNHPPSTSHQLSLPRYLSKPSLTLKRIIHHHPIVDYLACLRV